MKNMNRSRKIMKYPIKILTRHRTGRIDDHEQGYHVNYGKKYRDGNFRSERLMIKKGNVSLHEGDPETEKRIKVLADHLEIEKDEVEGIEQSSYDDKVFEYGSHEYLILTDSEADIRAYERVKGDLEESPEIFDETWLGSFIDKEEMAQELAEEDWYGWIDPEDEKEGDELNKMNDMDEYDDSKTYYLQWDEWRTEDEWIDRHYDNILDEFETYFPKGTWIDHLDIETATEDAISIDGRAHFLATYDGEENYYEDYYIYRIN